MGTCNIQVKKAVEQTVDWANAQIQQGTQWDCRGGCDS